MISVKLHHYIIFVLSLTILPVYNSVGQEIVDNESVNEDLAAIATPIAHVRIEGTELDDRLNGGSGDDTIDGKEGNDDLQGREGDDELQGGEGDDTIDGGPGDDELQGGEGDDTIDGGPGDDEIEGDSGDDYLVGGEDDDELDGGKGDDVLEGGPGKDELKGGKGADKFICDKKDTIKDFNSLEKDRISGDCEYIDKGIIVPKTPKTSLFGKSSK
ncbi:MAG: hypothetical protein MRJ93_12410 [Nitrososphaeraceae archaeon]|nr:hypothetical protein [Nitrososphaeraceae archaeon]